MSTYHFIIPRRSWIWKLFCLIIILLFISRFCICLAISLEYADIADEYVRKNVWRDVTVKNGLVYAKVQCDLNITYIPAYILFTQTGNTIQTGGWQADLNLNSVFVNTLTIKSTKTVFQLTSIKYNYAYYISYQNDIFLLVKYFYSGSVSFSKCVFFIIYCYL